MLFQTCMTFFRQQNIKEDIFRNVVAMDFHYMDERKKHFSKYLCVQQKKESHEGLEWHEGD